MEAHRRFGAPAQAWVRVAVSGGAARARSCCGFGVLPLIRSIPYLVSYSVPFFPKRQCGRTLGAARRVEWTVQLVNKTATRVAEAMYFSAGGPDQPGGAGRGRRRHYFRRYQTCYISCG